MLCRMVLLICFIHPMTVYLQYASFFTIALFIWRIKLNYFDIEMKQWFRCSNWLGCVTGDDWCGDGWVWCSRQAEHDLLSVPHLWCLPWGDTSSQIPKNGWWMLWMTFVFLWNIVKAIYIPWGHYGKAWFKASSGSLGCSTRQLEEL